MADKLLQSAHLLVLAPPGLADATLLARLHDSGHICETVTSTAEAVAGLQAQHFDLVLIDLPTATEGLAALRHIRRHRPRTELAVVLTMAHGTTELIVKAMEAGANDYLVHPFDATVALARIRTQLALLDSQRALHESIALNELVLSATNDGIWDWHAEGDQCVFSARLKEIIGYSAEELGDSPDWSRFIHPEDLPGYQADLTALLQGRIELLKRELRLVHKSGECRWVLVRSRAERRPDGFVTRMIGACTDLTDFRVQDSLTGLPNRALLDDRLNRCLLRRERDPSYQYAVCVLAIDRYAQVYDTFGSQAANALVCQVAEVLSPLVRQADTLAYVGGAELVMVLDPANDTLAALRWVERMEAAAAELAARQVLPIPLTLSIGIALSGQAHTGDLLQSAESAARQVQEQGGNGHAIFDQRLYANQLEQLMLERELRLALEQDDAIEAHFQPIVSLSNGSLIGFEALARWRQNGQLIPPGRFIPIAEQSDLILPLGERIMTLSLAQLAAWLPGNGGAPLTVSVNLSPRQFRQADLIDSLAETLAWAELPPGCVKLEITESVLMEDADGAERLLRALKGLGVQLSLDDFGTGYSSFNYLHRFPFDILKIDRSFVMRLGQDRRSDTLVASIIGLAHALDLQVVAEGVETAEQWDFLASSGCDYAQGFLIGRPEPAAQAGRWLSPVRRRHPY